MGDEPTGGLAVCSGNPNHAMYLNVHNELSTQAREHVGAMLNQALADEFALSAATRDYHWNVTGPQFHSLHQLFDEQYHEIDGWIEKLGERARVIGVVAQTSWTELISAPRFTPMRGADLSARSMLAALSALHDRMSATLRREANECAKEHGDSVTAELLNELSEYHESTCWLLGELLQDRERAQAS